MKKENYARKGFTLVELLIVIVVIGILSAMMMLSSTEAMSSAKASNIASNLRNLKTAVLSWYADHTDYVLTDNTIDFDKTKTSGGSKIENVIGTADKKANIEKYFNNEGSLSLTGTPAQGGYGVCDDGSGNWYVGYYFAANETSTVVEKLKGRAKTLGLVFGGTNPKDAKIDSATTTVVWMKVLGKSN